MAIIVHVIGPSSSYIVLLSSFFLVFLIISPVITTIAAAAAPVVDDSDALLKLKSSFINAAPLSSWIKGTKPCDKAKQWDGIVCSHGNLHGLQLEKFNLSGKIDIDALLRMQSLRTISIMGNSFSGPVPEFNKLGALRSLFLSGNQFSGEIPSNYFENMQALKKVWLSDNKFTGDIPSSLTQLPNLMELYLQNNQFSGKIPDFKQDSLVTFDVSKNKLNGEIPSKLSKFNEKAFAGNAELCGEKIKKSCLEPPASPPKPKEAESPKENQGDDDDKSEESSTSKIAIYSLIGCGSILLIVAIIFLLQRKKPKKFDVLEKNNHTEVQRLNKSASEKELAPAPAPAPAPKPEPEPAPATVTRRTSKSSSRRASQAKVPNDLVVVNDEKGEFGLPDLMKAAAEVLGNGSLGSSYKAMMSNGLTVVVKRVKDMSKLGKEAFDGEIRCLAKLKHMNILAPLAYHYRKDEKLIVNEYIPKGSLLYILHGDRGLLHAELRWPIRLKIIKGVARGLAYLHTELAHLELPHGDLRSSNILLSPEYEPLLADFGFHSMVNDNQAAQALFAYKSPEAILNQKVSPKCDVYCLGVIILELVTGKYPSQYLNNGSGGTDVLQWVRTSIAEGRESELIDPDIANSNSTSEMEQIIHIGAACIESNPEQRLDLGEAIRRIEGIQVEEATQEVNQSQVLPSSRDGVC